MILISGVQYCALHPMPCWNPSELLRRGLLSLYHYHLYYDDARPYPYSMYVDSSHQYSIPRG